MKKLFVVFCLTIVAGIIVLVCLFLKKKFIDQKIIKNPNYLVLVNDEPILKSDFEKKLTQTKHYYFWAKKDQMDLSSLPNDVLTQMVNLVLIRQFAQKHSLFVNRQELENRYQSIVKNHQSETELLKKINDMYGIDKLEYQTILTEEILKEKVQQYVKKGLVDWLIAQKQTAKIIWN